MTSDPSVDPAERSLGPDEPVPTPNQGTQTPDVDPDDTRHQQPPAEAD